MSYLREIVISLLFSRCNPPLGLLIHFPVLWFLAELCAVVEVWTGTNCIVYCIALYIVLVVLTTPIVSELIAIIAGGAMSKGNKKYEGGIFNNKGKRPTVNVIEKAQDFLVQFRVRRGGAGAGTRYRSIYRRVVQLCTPARLLNCCYGNTHTVTFYYNSCTL